MIPRRLARPTGSAPRHGLRTMPVPLSPRHCPVAGLSGAGLGGPSDCSSVAFRRTFARGADADPLELAPRALVRHELLQQLLQGHPAPLDGLVEGVGHEALGLVVAEDAGDLLDPPQRLVAVPRAVAR